MLVSTLLSSAQEFSAGITAEMLRSEVQLKASVLSGERKTLV